MHADEKFLQVAALIGEPSRAIILNCLLDGRMLPASELAMRARITPQTISSHLHKLVDGGLIAVEARGRYKYYRLANPEVAHVLEGLTTIAGAPKVQSLRQSDQLRAIQYARTCYDHLAGRVGVEFTQTLVDKLYLRESGKDYTLTDTGIAKFMEIGVDAVSLQGVRRAFARQCLDWSERRYHLAGALGAAVTTRLFDLQWIKRVPSTRAVVFTEEGRTGMRQHFGIELPR